ncbi:MAG: PEP/pyruvate-binding domain-containing protein [Candidatus Nanoarchaeia archaeon]|nr:PEP/pyruvate-binding domain-containing protein [Candidatus Nanoarchaeia archaeon]
MGNLKKDYNKEKSKEEVRLAGVNILWFNEIDKNDIAIVGGKGANLGEMFNHFTIPNGFCVTVNAYKQFIEENKLGDKIYALLSKLDVEDTRKLDEVSSKINEIIVKGKMPENLEIEIKSNYDKLENKFVAVRSSATAEDLPTASFAGQQATFLNVNGYEELIKAVKECFASLFTARAIVYRTINKFEHDKVFLSVVVQEMINSSKAGVMFTVNPVNKNHDEMIIEGSFGLGEMIVSGRVTPDTYFITKNPLKIKEKMINEKNTEMIRDKNGKNKILDIDYLRSNEQCLFDQEILELAEAGVLIEKHYGKPQDIEWAIDENGEVFILQSRPITTL